MLYSTEKSAELTAMLRNIRHNEIEKRFCTRSNVFMLSEPAISVFHPDRPGIRKVLGDLEAEIMELIWSRPFNS